jgi:hypothetical protein
MYHQCLALSGHPSVPRVIPLFLSSFSIASHLGTALLYLPGPKIWWCAFFSAWRGLTRQMSNMKDLGSGE